MKDILKPLFFVVFLDLLGVSILIPILGPLFLNTNLIFPSTISVGYRTILLGLLIAAYPLAQFFGAPLLGALSDRYGRKKILLISLTGTLVGYLLFGLGLIISNLPLLFFSRALDGLTGGNISVALSAIADTSDERSKAKNFGLIGMAFGLGFIMGPFIGGKLADPHVVSWFNFATPLWFAAILSLFNIILVWKRFDETLKTTIESPISLLTGFRNIKRAAEMKSLRTMFFVIFMLSFGFSFFTQFFQVFLIEKFHYSQGDIGDLFAFVGFFIALTQGVITRIAAKYLQPEQVMYFSPVGLAIALPLLLVPSRSANMFFVLPFIALFQGLTYPNSTAVISNLADKKSQGEILGINQSLQSLAMSIPPIIAGFIVSFHMNLPIMVASICTFIAWGIFMGFFTHGKKKFHEI